MILRSGTKPQILKDDALPSLSRNHAFQRSCDRDHPLGLTATRLHTSGLSNALPDTTSPVRGASLGNSTGRASWATPDLINDRASRN